MATYTKFNFPILTGKSVLVKSDSPYSRRLITAGDNWEIANTENGQSALYITVDKTDANLALYKYCPITELSIAFGNIFNITTSGTLAACAADAYNENTLTWDTRPTTTRISVCGWDGYYNNVTDVSDRLANVGRSPDGEVLSYLETYKIMARLLQAPAIALMMYETPASFKQTSMDIYLRMQVKDSDTLTSVVKGTNKDSGYVPPNVSQTFTWDFFPDSNDYYCYGTWTQASATFYWRQGTSGAYTSVSASGSTKSVTIPANTFPTGTIQWYVTATDNQGTTTSSPVYTIKTQDEPITTTPISPINTIEDGDAGILFTWSINSPSGTLPQASVLRYKYNPTDPFTDIAVSGPATSYTVPGGTFTGGTVIWGVNVQNEAGIWSSNNPTTQFVCVAAPPAPAVTADGVPFATIQWQSTGQQAWRITVDGKLYGPYFGSAKSFQIPDYLLDGEHTAAVEVQGQYGLWSQAGTVSFTVTNVPGDAVTLRAVCYRDAALSWSSDSTTDDWLIYRDGVRIGHTAVRSFTDRRSIGRHTWQVINRLAGGSYTASNIVQGELRSCTPAAVPLEGGEWLELRKSDAQTREDIWQGSQTAAIRHFAGEAYPTAEFAAFKDETVSLTVAWMPEEAEEARIFESLIGQPVIYKNRDRMLIGVLQAYNLRRPQFYRAYSVTMTRIHWRDFVDENP